MVLTGLAFGQGQFVGGAGTGGNFTGGFLYTDVFALYGNNAAAGPDMCAKISFAIANQPGGGGGQGAGAVTGVTTTYDARGFTGIQVCSAIDANNMFNPLRSASNRGGILLLGDVSLYVDGPASGPFTDPCATNSNGVNGPCNGVTPITGTPAILVPSNFSIFGMGRGSANGNNPPSNTIIGACATTNLPVTGCHNPFPTRQFTVTDIHYVNNAGVIGSSSTTTGACTPNGPGSTANLCALQITIGVPFVASGGGGTDVANANVYLTASAGSGEAVALTFNVGQGGTQATPPTAAGMYRANTICTGAAAGTGLLVPLCTGANTMFVTEATGFVITGCATAGTCQALLSFDGAPLLALAPPGANGWTTQYGNSNNPSFGQKLAGFAIDTSQQYIDAIANMYGQEQGGLTQLNGTNLSWLFYETATNNEQNYGPINQLQMTTGGSNTTCGPHTTGIFLKSTNLSRTIAGITYTASATQCNAAAGAARVNAAFMVDASNQVLVDVHGEGQKDVVLLGANNNTGALTIQNVVGGPASNATINTVHIVKEFASNDFLLNAMDVNTGGGNTVQDDQYGCTITDTKTSIYGFDALSVGGNASMLTTSPTCPSILFGNKVQLGVAYTNNTATASTIFSFPVAVKSNWTIHCHGLYKAAASGKFAMTVTAPAGLAVVEYDFREAVAVVANVLTENDFSASSSALTGLGTVVTTAATDMPWDLTLQFSVGATNSGTINIQGLTVAGDLLTVEAGSSCQMY